MFTDLDPSREQAWADQVTQYLRVGKIVWLPSPMGKFLALSMEAIGRGANHGGVILLPAPDTYPDSNPIGALRTALPHHGWYTLAIQLPTLVVESTPADYVSVLHAACARLQAAITWFDEQRISNLVVLGHGLGAAVAAACVANMKDKDALQGIILLEAGGAGTLPAALDPAGALEKIKLPILDLYGEEDTPAVRTGARAREAGRRNRSRPYVQVVLPGVGYSLADAEDIVVKRVATWLLRYAPGQEFTGGR